MTVRAYSRPTVAGKCTSGSTHPLRCWASLAHGTMALPSHCTTDLVIGQTEQTFDSVPPPELPPSIRLSDLLDSLNMTKGMTQLSCASCWTPPRECLRVNVLGTSVANGCGGAEPPHSTRCADRKVDMKARCDVKMSWVRHMHDALRVWATGSGTHPTTTLHARNGASSLRTPLLRAA